MLIYIIICHFFTHRTTIFLYLCKEWKNAHVFTFMIYITYWLTTSVGYHCY